MAAPAHQTIQAFKAVFLASAGEPPVPWRRSIGMFERHLIASGLVDDATNQASVVRTSALLVTSLGVEGYRVYASLTNEVNEDFDAARATLAAHFDKRPSLWCLSSSAIRPMFTATRRIGKSIRGCAARARIIVRMDCERVEDACV